MQVGFAKTPILVAAVGLIIGLASIDTLGQSETLFSHNRYPGQRLRNCITFVENKEVKKEPSVKPIEVQTLGSPIELQFPGKPIELTQRPCDVTYGNLWAGDSMDWLQSSGAKGNRSVIRDLGPYTWTDTFMVPVVAPFPKLKPGEVRTVTVDVSGGRRPRIDPLFVKAVVGHMYVIHVVDDDHDFYALFRVDQLLRGDSCVVSWKLVDAPSEAVRQN